MAISNVIASMYSNVDNAYSAIATKGGTIPASKNLYNLASAIDTISGGGGDDKSPEIIMRTISEYNDVNGDVTQVGSYAFNGCGNLTSVNFPNCSNIGKFAFANCTNLTSISAPNCLLLDSSALAGCSNLTSVNFPKCERIEERAFANDTNLRNVNLQSVSYVGMYAFSSCKSLFSISLPYCLSVGTNAFQGCTSLSIASIPNCSNLGGNAFTSCWVLSSAYFPMTNQTNTRTFWSCLKLSQALLGNALLQSSVFEGCTSLQSVYLLSSTPGNLSASVFIRTPILDSSYLGYYGSIYVPSAAVETFKSATNWASLSDRIVAMPSSIENQHIIPYEFRNMSTFASEKINATTIGSRAFESNTYSGTVSMPYCECIGAYAFYSCSLTQAIFENCKVLTGDWTFGGCLKLSYISFPNLVMIGSQGAFASCKISEANLVVKYVPPYTFQRCQSLTSVNLPNCAEIGSSAFDYCASLTTISIPECLRLVNLAFNNCTQLSKISLPKVKKIYPQVFTGCISLTVVDLTQNSNIIDLGTNAFSTTPMVNSTYTGNFGSIYVPSSLYSQYIVATNWSNISARITSTSVPV